MQIKLNELVKREQERMNVLRAQQTRNVVASQTSKINSDATKKVVQPNNMSIFCSSNNAHHNSRNTNASANCMNKSQSAFNLASNKK